MKSAWNIEHTQISRIILSSRNDVVFPPSSPLPRIFKYRTKMAQGDRGTLQLKFLTGWLAVVWKEILLFYKYFIIPDSVKVPFHSSLHPHHPQPLRGNKRRQERQGLASTRETLGRRNKEGMSSTEKVLGWVGEDRKSNKKSLLLHD